MDYNPTNVTIIMLHHDHQEEDIQKAINSIEKQVFSHHLNKGSEILIYPFKVSSLSV